MSNSASAYPTIRQVAVLGAGVMGAQIAAHLVNAGVATILFDLPGEGAARYSIVQKALQGLKSLNPAPLGVPSIADAIQLGNYEDDLARLGQCDLVIEAIVERKDLKHALYQKIAPHLASHAVLATNTSGIPLQDLATVLPPALQQRFCGVHFFNPPRYMNLVELIATAHTEPVLLDRLETFLTRVLGKGVVRALDTPNFIANRVGIFSILAIMHWATQFQLPFDVVDDLTGTRLGRAKSATFRTADVVGLDTLAHVIRTMQEGLPNDPFAPVYAMPAVLQQLIGLKQLGQKTGAGFFKKQGKAILVFHPASADYQAGSGGADPAVLALLKERDVSKRWAALRQHQHPQAQFLWSIVRDVLHYVAVHLQAIADCARDVDRAMCWGFGWSQGPFELWQAIGWDTVSQWIADDIAAGKTLAAVALPSWVQSAPIAGQGVASPQGSWSPQAGAWRGNSALPVYQRVLATPWQSPAGGKVVEENAGACLWTADGFEDIAIVSFKTKMHVISPEVIAMIHRAIALGAAGVFSGIVLGGHEAPFSAGADLSNVLPIYVDGGSAAIAPLVAAFQEASQAIRYSTVPVVTALRGMVLGGGCEFAMHSARRVAYFETYMGLVEVGVGLIPAGGGLKEIARRASLAAQRQDAALAASPALDLLPFLKPGFKAAAMATVSKSALEARELGYLSDTDPVVMHDGSLLLVALSEARQMANAGYRPPLPEPPILVAGEAGWATFKAQLINLREGGFITEHDFTLAETIARVLCMADLPGPTRVDEAALLEAERREFLQLIDNTRTQERLMGMLQTGKPVRN